MTAYDPSLPLNRVAQETYAVERSFGIPPTEAVRRTGNDPRNGLATKWEASRRVRARIRYLRSLGDDDKVLAEKRQRIEQRLAAAAYGNIFDFATIDPVTNRPVIDWKMMMESETAVTISEFTFDADTGMLTRFKRDDALNAAAQLRDMHGFKSVNKTALTDPSGAKSALGELAQLLGDIDGKTRALADKAV